MLSGRPKQDTVLALVRRSLNPSIGHTRLERQGPWIVTTLLGLAGILYLFGVIPGDRVTGLMALLAGVGGGFFVRHQA